MIFFTLQVTMCMWLLKKNCNSVLICLSCCQLITKSTVLWVTWSGRAKEWSSLVWWFGPGCVNFKHKIGSWLRDSTDKSSSKASWKGSSRSKKSSRSNKSSSSSKSSTKLKLLEEKAKVAELEAEATFLLEKQKAENQVKILQIQGEVARAKARARVYEGYNQIEVNTEVDEVESNVYEENVQQRLRYSKDQRQENLRLSE